MTSLSKLFQTPPRRIALFRALVLGDVLCAVPAWRAVRNAWPDSEISFIGLPWAAEWVARTPWIDRFIEFPGFPALPERVPDLAALPRFLADMQAERFDLLLQMHGSGGVVNPLLAIFGARHQAGFVEPDQEASPLHVAWPTSGHEIERMLALTDHLGLPRCGTALEFPLTDADRRQAAALVAPAGDRPYVCIHAGAQLPSRRWLPERFAEVARRLADAGQVVVLTGTSAERQIVDTIKKQMNRPVIDVCRLTDLWTMGALIEGSELLVCNDTGVSHIAAALGTPSVVISCGADVSRWAPLDATLHSVIWHDVSCRPCAHRQCPYDHICATAISAAEVHRDASLALTAVRTRHSVCP